MLRGSGIAVTACAVVMAAYFGSGTKNEGRAEALREGLSIGTQNSMTGGSLCKTFSTNALTEGAGSIVGTVQNGLGNDMTDCSVTIHAVGAGTPPKVTGGTIGTATLTEVSGHPGRYRAQFSPPTANGGAGTVSINTEGPASQPASPEFKICFNPSSTNTLAGGELDHLEAFDLSSSRTTETRGCDVHGNTGVRAWLRNQNSGDRPERLVALEGLIEFPAGTSNEVLNAYATASLTTGQLQGATVTMLSATQFRITGLNVAGAQSILIDVVFAQVPPGSTTLKLVGTFKP